MRWRRRKEREQDLDRELRSHLELEAADQLERGLPSEAARAAVAGPLTDDSTVTIGLVEMINLYLSEQPG